MSNEPFSIPDSEEDRIDRLFHKLGRLSKLVYERVAAGESQDSSTSGNDLVNSVLADLPESADGSSRSVTAIFQNLLRRISRSIPFPHEDYIQMLLQDESEDESGSSNTAVEDFGNTATLTNIEDNLTVTTATLLGLSANASSSDEPATNEVEASTSTDKVSDTVGEVVKPERKNVRGKGKGKKRARNESDDEHSDADQDGRNTKIPKLDTGDTLGSDVRSVSVEPVPSIPKRARTFKELKESLLESTH